jgi:hypothetical protein
MTGGFHQFAVKIAAKFDYLTETSKLQYAVGAVFRLGLTGGGTLQNGNNPVPGFVE